jgi:hypothetical protein
VNQRSRNLLLFALLAAACGGSVAAFSDLQANGQPPAELLQCATSAAATGSAGATGGACPNTCPNLLPQGAWNAADAGTGNVTALVELPDSQVVFGDQGAITFLGGVPYATDSSVTSWRGAGRIPGADGTGDWAVGIDASGQLRRASGAGALTAVSDRFGLLQEKVVALAGAGDGKGAVFALESGLAVSDGTTLQRYGAMPTAVAGGGGKVAWLETGAVRRLDPQTGVVDQWKLQGAVAVALSASGKLLAATPGGLWSESPTTNLVQVYQTQQQVHGLAATGERFWFAQGVQVGYLEGAAVERTRAGVTLIDSGAPLFPAEGGGVWTLTAGQPHRYSAGGQLAVWQQMVLPVFSRVCSQCHLPGGTAGVPLSSLAQWQALKTTIEDRVLNPASDKPMPPVNAAATITPQEKATLQCWLGTQQ